MGFTGNIRSLALVQPRPRMKTQEYERTVDLFLQSSVIFRLHWGLSSVVLCLCCSFYVSTKMRNIITLSGGYHSRSVPFLPSPFSGSDTRWLLVPHTKRVLPKSNEFHTGQSSEDIGDHYLVAPSLGSCK